ncbi:MAG: TetR/AcrR family transcriptional regulator [Bacilli bacterium]|nr:TetR/AcrR family transcriptional regulator [Bacilli bacterium]
MDKRILKTKAAIYSSLADLLLEKDFDDLSVEDILERSGVSRSTFYAHFKTKGDVLDSISRNIFDHVFSHGLSKEHSHDFSAASIFEYETFFVHILYHLKDEEKLIHAILLSSCKQRFFKDLREKMTSLVHHCIHDGLFTRKDVPEDYQVRSIVESFLSLIEYWFATNLAETPEKTASYFIAINK